MGRAPLTMLVVACVCDADSDEVQDLGLMVGPITDEQSSVS